MTEHERTKSVIVNLLSTCCARCIERRGHRPSTDSVRLGVLVSRPVCLNLLDEFWLVQEVLAPASANQTNALEGSV